MKLALMGLATVLPAGCTVFETDAQRGYVQANGWKSTQQAIKDFQESVHKPETGVADGALLAELGIK